MRSLLQKRWSGWTNWNKGLLIPGWLKTCPAIQIQWAAAACDLWECHLSNLAEDLPGFHKSNTFHMAIPMIHARSDTPWNHSPACTAKNLPGSVPASLMALEYLMENRIWFAKSLARLGEGNQRNIYIALVVMFHGQCDIQYQDGKNHSLTSWVTGRDTAFAHFTFRNWCRSWEATSRGDPRRKKRNNPEPNLASSRPTRMVDQLRKMRFPLKRAAPFFFKPGRLSQTWRGEGWAASSCLAVSSFSWMRLWRLSNPSAACSWAAPMRSSKCHQKSHHDEVPGKQFLKLRQIKLETQEAAL